MPLQLESGPDCGGEAVSPCADTCLVHSSGLSGREAERDRCAAGVQERDVCLPCHGIPLMAFFFLPLVVQVGIASFTSVSKHVFSSQTCYFDFFPQSSGKGTEAEVGHLRLCHPPLWVWDSPPPAPASGLGKYLLAAFLCGGF